MGSIAWETDMSTTPMLGNLPLPSNNSVMGRLSRDWDRFGLILSTEILTLTLTSTAASQPARVRWCRKQYYSPGLWQTKEAATVLVLFQSAFLWQCTSLAGNWYNDHLGYDCRVTVSLYCGGLPSTWSHNNNIIIRWYKNIMVSYN